MTARAPSAQDRDPQIVRIRELRVQLDRAVADSYGWADLTLDHDFRETPLGVRFTVSEPVRIELLDRLLSGLLVHTIVDRRQTLSVLNLHVPSIL